MHAVQIAVIAVYIMFAPPQSGIASYTYAELLWDQVHLQMFS